jgi:trk system potassium uptake protein
MWLLSLLIFFRLSLSWVQSHYVYEIIFDCVLLYMVWPLIKKIQVGQAIQAWRYLKYRQSFRKRIEFISAIVLDILRIMAFCYLGFWLLRWTQVDWTSVESTIKERDLNFLDAFFLCFFLSQVATAHKWGWWLSKFHFSHGRQILFHYLVTIFLATFLLLMPFAVQPHQSLSLIDSFFLSVSALSVTGLSPVDISQVLTQWGQFILLVLIQLGGFGVIMITAAVSFAANRRVSLSSMVLGQTTFGTANAGDMPRFLTKVFSVTVLFESFGALFLYFSLPEGHPHRLFHAIFHSVSAFCNAGFSLFPDSLNQSPLLGGGLIVICFLIILGGLGFPVLFDLEKMLKQKKSLGWDSLSPYSRLVLLSTVVLLLGGASFFFLFESFHSESSLGFFELLGQSLFYSVSSRTAGFNLLPVDTFHPSVQAFLLLLMAIGANPASTGGGLKTTTVGVLFITVYNTLRNQDQAVIFGRSISYNIVKKALSIVVLYLMIAGLAMTILIVTEGQSSLEISFEVISALSTVGLSLGLTSKLSFLGKLVVMFLMLFGRIGILTIVLAGIGEKKKSNVRYPEDDFFIG